MVIPTLKGKKIKERTRWEGVIERWLEKYSPCGCHLSWDMNNK